MFTTLLVTAFSGDDVVSTAFSLSLTKQHLRVTATDEDTLIQAYIDAAMAEIDGPDGWLGRSLSVQTIVHRVDAFDTLPMHLPYGPVIEITSVEHIDSDGEWQTIDAEDYELDEDYLHTVWGGSWPSTGYRQGAVRVTYQAGGATLDSDITAAILFKVEAMYRRAEDPEYSRKLDDLADRKLSTKRVYH